jgi:glucose dehydrogenase
MSDPAVAIVGSGVVGTTIAYMLTQQGHAVDIFEKGPLYPYPHAQQWREVYSLGFSDPAYGAASDLNNISIGSDLPFNLRARRKMRVGGSATEWAALTVRMHPNDFRTRTLYGYGDDWPITYDDLEPYYGRAEALIGVSGTDDDNPFARPRSTPYPLPPFELAYDDVLLGDRLREAGIILHTTPQARTRLPYDQRPGCANFGTCRFCPIGVRYSPSLHLERAVNTGRCFLYPNVSVRRIIADANGSGATVVFQENDSAIEQERHYDVVVIAAHTIESARLLLLSKHERHPDGLGNASGWVGQGFTFHNSWNGVFEYDVPLHPGRFGGWTAQSNQFLDVETRGQHGGVQVEFSSLALSVFAPTWAQSKDVESIRGALESRLHQRIFRCLTDVPGSPEKYITLSTETDRYGDPFAHVEYSLSDFDHATYEFCTSIFERFRDGSGAVDGSFAAFERYDDGYHHLGSCRMSEDADSGVVNSFGQIHGHERVLVVGGSMFVDSGGAVYPTLTMVALAIRSADYILDQLL